MWEYTHTYTHTYSFKEQAVKFTGELVCHKIKRNIGCSKDSCAICFFLSLDKDANTSYLLTTGSSDKTKIYNIFDVAGNLWEWNVETNSTNRVYRGGSSVDDSGTFPACYRDGHHAPTHTDGSIGFRVVLYVL